MLWLILAFLTALFTSISDALSKKILKKTDVYIVAWSWPAFSLPFLWGLLLIEKPPPLGPSFWPAVCFSSIILTYAVVIYYKAIQSSDLSITVVMLTFTPIFLLITSPIMLGEVAAPKGVIGIFFIVGGAYVLNFKDRNKGLLAPFKSLLHEKGPRYMLIVAVLYSIGANVDKIGVLNSSPLMWTTSIATVTTISVGILMLRKVKNIRAQIKLAWPYLLLLGFCSAVSILFQMNAIKMAMVPYVIAIKRTSAIMTALFGFFVFKEKGFKERLIGAILMVIGVLLISIV